MHRLDDMKTYPALLALAAGATAAMIVVIAHCKPKIALSRATVLQSIVRPLRKTPRHHPAPSDLPTIIATRACEQQFNYCQYRRESRDHCARLLINCRRNC
jgi:hypothetical protein